jgi:adenine/guanine phosphoribosyltransferase-like PRPP-binding protein
LEVVCFCTYLTDIGSGWRPDDYNAHDFIHAIKDRNLNGYAMIPLRGKRLRVDNSNRQDVVDWFAAMVVDYFKEHHLPRNVALVPVPGSKCDVTFTGKPRTTILAEAIAQELSGATVRDVLRWKTAMPSANAQGGTRDAAILFANLLLGGSVDGASVVLVDDVLTSGGHLQACAARLREKRARVRRAVCAGRADAAQPKEPFAVRTEEVDDFEP